MDGKEEKPKKSTCASRGPGPVYRLPTLVGYDGHDPSKYRSPAFTIKSRVGINVSGSGPGPSYVIDHLTRYGKDRGPAFTIGSRKLTSKQGDCAPGPGAYHPEKCPPMNHSVRPAAFSIKSRTALRMCGDGPGPIYLIPSCIGPKIPDKTALGAFSMAGRHGKDYCDSSPGPAAYVSKNYDLIKPRLPAYSLASRRPTELVGCGPGPIYYSQFITGKKSPMYSFGVKHSECASTAIAEQDED